MKIAAIVLGVLGVLAIVAAIIYYTVPAHSLPSFMGPLPHVKVHRTKRGEAALIAGIVLLVASIVLGIISARNNRRAAY